MEETRQAPGSPGWITPTVVGIVLATLFSDFGHEMVTAMLPAYLLSLGLGPAALGTIEGVADFLVSLSKLGGGLAGHRLARKKPLVVAGYLVTTLGTSAMGLARGLPLLLGLRTAAWIGRGFRGPLRDFLLSDEVKHTHYGRAFGLERGGDMLGAVSGPLVAAALVGMGLSLGHVMLWALVPGSLAALAVLVLVRERRGDRGEAAGSAPAPRAAIPRTFWLLLGGILLFGLGDFSRTFLIWIATRSLARGSPSSVAGVYLPVLLYAGHNVVSALAAYPIGQWADRASKPRILMAGYALAAATNVLLAFRSGELGWIVGAFVLSGIYISIKEVVEKASVADLLPRHVRSLGLGILAMTNALGDMASSLGVGFLLRRSAPEWAFGIPAVACGASVLWLLAVLGRRESPTGEPSRALAGPESGADPDAGPGGRGGAP